MEPMSTNYDDSNRGNERGMNYSTTTVEDDPFLNNDFFPLEHSNAAVLSALRYDESSLDSDLYRKIASAGIRDDAASLSYAPSSPSNHSQQGPGAMNGGSNYGGSDLNSCYRFPMAVSASQRTPPPLSTTTNSNGNYRSNNVNPGVHAASNTSPMRNNTKGFLSPPSRNVRFDGMQNSPTGINASGLTGNVTTPMGHKTSTITRMTPIPVMMHQHSFPLPPYLTQLLKGTKISSLMGILPETNMVWVSIDDYLYLWEYDCQDGLSSSSVSTTVTGNDGINKVRGTASMTGGGEDFVCFQVPSGQCVVSVGLVKPKLGVFTEVVDWCLIVSTPEEVILCALARKPTSSQSIPSPSNVSASSSATTPYETHLHLIPTRYIIPTDSIPILSICGTKDGRIFLGGNDGCLYEMAYEGFFQYRKNRNDIHAQTNIFSDKVNHKDYSSSDDYLGNDEFDLDSIDMPPSNSEMLIVGGKRLLSNLVFGPYQDNTSLMRNSPSSRSSLLQQQRPRKCRKINHTSIAPTIVTAIVPNFLLRATVAVFGGILSGGSTNSIITNAGSIVDMQIDVDRHTLYALTSKGFVHTFDLVDTNKSISSFSGGPGYRQPSPPRLVSTIDVSKSARRYLDSVARGMMYPPHSSYDSSVATIVFPGGGAGAQTGVGGMNGARAILKESDIDIERANTVGSVSNSMRMRTKHQQQSSKILHPISIHVVPPCESTSLTLVALTAGGLRYYLSALSNVGPGTSTNYGDNFLMNPKRLGSRFTLSHIRAPPPFIVRGSGSTSDDILLDGGYQHSTAASTVAATDAYNMKEAAVKPSIFERKCFATKGLYTNGCTFLAIGSNNIKNSNNIASNETVADCIMAITPDLIGNSQFQSDNNEISFSPHPMDPTNKSGIGLNEIASLPMTQSMRGADSQSLLPGGRVWGVSSIHSSVKSSAVWNLITHSCTPTDSELSVGLIPAYFPPDRILKKHLLQEFSSKREMHTDKLFGTAGNPTTSSSLINTPLAKSYNKNLISSTLNLISTFFGNRRHVDAQRRLTGTNNMKNEPSYNSIYRISERVGCSLAGFSSTAKGKVTSSGKVSVPRSSRRSPRRGRNTNVISRSARLSPWLITPHVSPLSEISINHIFKKCKQRGVVALNSGGLHFFSQISPIQKMATILKNSKTSNMGKDEKIKILFKNFGHIEGCAMCISIAINENDDVVKRRAIEAAMKFAHRPSMVNSTSSHFPGKNVSNIAPFTTIGNLDGYTFQPSCLYIGLLRLVSRHLRPIWFKPAVVVTEGRSVSSMRYGNKVKTIPAKVEFLLDDATLDEIRHPLMGIQVLMKDIFARAISSIPGAKPVTSIVNGQDRLPSNGVEDHHLLTEAIQYQHRLSAQNKIGSHQYSDKERSNFAILEEERSIHALYRLVSRTVHCLTLLSYLRRAHFIPDLPEVDFGLLHGLTYSQLVSRPNVHQRIETILTNLVSSNESLESLRGISPSSSFTAASAESNNLSSLLARHCYLYFSAGSRLTYLGFKTAHRAIMQQSQSNLNIELSNRAAAYLCRAARHWYNPALVTGRLFHDDSSTKDNTAVTPNQKQSAWYNDLALRALEFGSPLARAAAALMELSNINGVVDMCLICAGNFGGSKDRDNLESDDFYDDKQALQSILPWEKGLYHQPTVQDTSDNEVFRGYSHHNTTNTHVVGLDVMHSDANSTCHAILFHHLTVLLDSSSQSNEYMKLADQMISVASSSSDKKFRNSLYQHLINVGHTEFLLQICSEDLEEWLKESHNDHTLLSRYYSANSQYWMAGEVMWERGCGPIETRIRIEDRIECLTRAKNAYQACLEKDPASYYSSNSNAHSKPPPKDEITQIIEKITDQLDVALLQSRTLSIIRTSEIATQLDEKNIDDLSYSLLNSSDLFNQFTARFDLYDICLLILHSCRHNDAAKITTLWRSIICKEILPCRTQSSDVEDFLNALQLGSLFGTESVTLIERDDMSEGVDDKSVNYFENSEWVTSLKNRIISLGKELYGNGFDCSFPHTFIIECMEGLHRQQDSLLVSDKRSCLIPSWPLQTVMEIGIPFPAIFDAYNSILEKNPVTDLSNPMTRLYQLASLSEILKLWLSHADSPMTSNSITNGICQNSSSNVRSQLLQFSKQVLSKLDLYKNLLESLVGPNHNDIMTVHSSFSEVEEVLKRMITN